VISPLTSSTAQIDSDAPLLSIAPPFVLRSQPEGIDEKSVAENVKPAEDEPARELPKDTQPQVISSVATVKEETSRIVVGFSWLGRYVNYIPFFVLRAKPEVQASLI
jgi:hypothetical protein